MLTLFHDDFFAMLRAARSHQEAGEYKEALALLDDAMYIAPTGVDRVQVRRRIDRLTSLVGS